MKKRIVALLAALCLLVQFVPAVAATDTITSADCAGMIENVGNFDYEMSDLVWGEDDVLYTPEGYPVFIALDNEADGGLSYWLNGYTLKAYVDAYGEEFFCLDGWDVLLSMMDENGYVLMTPAAYECLYITITGNPNWGEDDESYMMYYLYIGVDEAYYTSCGTDLEWTLEDGTLTISGSGAMYDFETRPAPWSDSLEEITSVVIEPDVTSIGMYAFDSCTNLTSVVIAETVTTIAGFSFNNCTALEAVWIPASVTEISDAPFVGCTSLTAINVSEDSRSFSSVDGILYDKYQVELVQVPGSYEGVLTLPETVQAIWPWACSFCVNLDTVVIPDGLLGIADNAFSFSGITEVYIPESVVYMGSNLFNNCESLDTAHIKASIDALPSGTFNYCSALSYAELPDGISSIGMGAFNCCTALQDLTLPASVTSIGMLAFQKCESLLELELPACLQIIEDYAFNLAGLTQITVPYSVEYIGYGAFRKCTGLTSVTFEGAYPENCEMMFEGVTATVNYPANLSGWTEDVLQDYGGTITWVPYEKEITAVDSGTCGENLTWEFWEDGSLIISGQGAMDNYNLDESGETETILAPWYSYRDQISNVIVEEGVTTIGNYAFMDLQMVAVSIPDGVTSIGNSAFYGCGSLLSVVVPGSVETIGSGAFSACYRLSSVTLSEGLVTIGRSAFTGCCMDELTIPSTVTSIGDNAFFHIHLGVNDIDITFLGDAPQFGEEAFYVIDATVYYPGTNETWTEDVLQSYGGNSIIWIALDENGNVITPDYTSADYALMLENMAYSSDNYKDLVLAGDGVYYGSEGMPAFIAVDNAADGGIGYWLGGDTLKELVEQYSDSLDLTAWNELYAMADENGYVLLTQQTWDLMATLIAQWDEYEDMIPFYVFYGCNDETYLTRCGDNAYWSYADGVLTISGEGAMYDFSDNTRRWQEYIGDITTVIVEEGITYIGTSSFVSCGNLSSVSLPDTLVTIGGWAFCDCGSLTGIDLPAGLEYIQNYAFNYSGLTQITIPASVQAVESGAFADCWYLEAINVSEDNENYCSVDGVLYFNEMTDLAVVPGAYKGALVIPDGVISIAEYAAAGCQNLTSVTIPEGVLEIGYRSFAGCNILNTVVLPQSLLVIGTSAFSECYNLANVTLPENLELICNNAFQYCEKLTQITIPASVVEIGRYAFRGCSGLKKITFLGDAPELYYGIFDSVTATVYYPADNATWTEDVMQDYNGTITWVTSGSEEEGGEDVEDPEDPVDPEDPEDPEITYTYICEGTCGEGVTWGLTADGILVIDGEGEMDSYGYYHDEYMTDEPAPWYSYRNSIKTVIIKDGVTKLGASAFEDCTQVTEVTIGSGVTEILIDTFANCTALTSVTMSDNVTAIYSSAFAGCQNLTQIRLSSGLTSISSGAFAGSGLQSITLPASLTSLDSLAFYGCASLTAIYVDEDNTVYSSDEYGVLLSKDKITLLLAPAGFVGEYTVPDTVKGIEERAFYDCDSLTGVTMTSVGVIDQSAFSYCDNLAYVNFGSSLTTIGGWAFEGCTSLKSVVIPDSVISMGNCVFEGCSSLESAVVGSGITYLPNHTFSYCTSLTDVTLSENLTTIALAVFSHCESLRSIDLPDSLKNLGSNVFSGSGLVGITIPDGVTKLYSEVLGSCDNLRSVIIGSGVVSIDTVAFTDSYALRSVTFRGDAPTFNTYAFSHTSLTAYYPAGNSTWTEDVLQNYSGEVTWRPYYGTMEDTPDTWGGEHIDDLVVHVDADYENFLMVKVDGKEVPSQHYTVSYGSTIVTISAEYMATLYEGMHEVVVEFTDGASVVHLEVEGTGVTDPCADGHSYDAVVTEPTCAEDGYTTHTCANCADSYVDERTGATGHNHEAVVTEPTCSEQGYTTHTCVGCGDSYVDSYVDARGHYVTETVKEMVDSYTTVNDAAYPFEVVDGWYCSTNKNNSTISVFEIHAVYDCTLTLTYDVSSERSYDKMYIAKNSTTLYTVSGEIEEQTVEIQLTAGDVVYIKYYKDYSSSSGADTAYFKIDACTQTEMETTVYISTDEVEPTCGNPVICESCQQVMKEAPEHSYGEWYSVSATEQRRDCENCDHYETKTVSSNPFTDVSEKKYYYEPIMWAVENGVTSGRTPTYFGVGETCTREQIVTFLWRAMGEPQPTTTVSPFTDVQNSNSYYYKAVLWAVENNITSGRTATYFGVGEDCTRAQIVTFLWRAMGQQNPTNMVSSFPDVQNSSSYYYKAVLWAVEEGITSGMADGTFGVEKACTREQCVTFLYRALANK